MLLIETAINRYLSLDPELLGKLAAFEGKVIKMEITGVNKNFYLFPNESGIQVSDDYDGEADTVLRGSPMSLFKMGLVSNTATMLLKGEVDISGDTRLGHQFKNVFSQMDIDWLEPLSAIVGDGLAFHISQSVKQFGLWGNESISSVSSSCSEYLQEESRDAVTGTELNIFNDQVDQLRNDVDRLEARISTLSKHT